MNDYSPFVHRAFFPLRSNFGWLQNPNLLRQLELRLKLALLIYDEIIVEDGTYQGTLLETFKIEFYSPPGKIPASQRKISIERDIKQSHVRTFIQPKDTIEIHPPIQIASGDTLLRIKMDYFQFLQGVDLQKYDCIKLVSLPDTQNLSSELKEAIDELNKIDFQIVSEFDNNLKIARIISNNLNRDLIISSLMGSGLVVDPVHERAIYQKARNSLKVGNSQLIPDAQYSVGQKLLSIRVPNLDVLSLEQVMQLRDDPTWTDFRGRIVEVSNLVRADPAIIWDSPAFDNAIHSAIEDDLLKTIESQYDSPMTFTVKLAFGLLGFVPVLGTALTALGLIQDGVQFYRQRNNWTAFLIKASKMGCN
ncbi:MAG: hypothetical protein R3A44_31095 [Caldilineaceae bacterium]